MKSLKWDGCFTATMALSGGIKHSMIVKVCSRSIMGGATPVYNEKNRHRSSRRAFLLRPISVSRQRKVDKVLLVSDRMLFYPYSLDFCDSEFNHISSTY